METEQSFTSLKAEMATLQTSIDESKELVSNKDEELKKKETRIDSLEDMLAV